MILSPSVNPIEEWRDVTPMPLRRPWRESCLLSSFRDQGRRVTARAMTVCITGHVRAGEERRGWRRTCPASSVTYPGAAVGIGIWGEARSAEDRKRVDSSRTFNITNHRAAGAQAAGPAFTPGRHSSMRASRGARGVRPEPPKAARAWVVSMQYQHHTSHHSCWSDARAASLADRMASTFWSTLSCFSV